MENMFLVLEDWWEKARRKVDWGMQRSAQNGKGNLVTAVTRRPSRPWPETVASHGRDFSDSRPWLETVGSHGRDFPKLTAVTHLQKRRIFLSARGVLGDLLRTFGGIFDHNSIGVFTTCKGYKYPILFTSKRTLEIIFTLHF